MGARPEGLERAVAQSHTALGLIVNGDPSGYMALLSEHEDVSLGNPFGPFASGQEQVRKTLADAATRYRGGEVIGVDPIASHVTDSLAVVVEVERYRAKVGASDETVTVGLRITSVFRPEPAGWRLVHRHADPITTPRSSESIVS